VEFRILGPLEVRDGERVLSLGGARRRAVLGILLLDANRVVSVDSLVDGVWGDTPPASVHASLQNHVSRLREELGDRLETRAPGYSLRVAPDELDFDRFRRLVADADGAEPAIAAERLREALSLWRGSPLADLAGEPAGRAAAHLGELRLAALEDRIDADLALGRHAALLPELEELVRQEPYRERLRRQLILALYRSGRQADALEAYTTARRVLVDEVGAEPGRELQELHHAVLRQDPSLDAPADIAPAPVARARVEERRTVTVLAAHVQPDIAPDDPEARRAVVRDRSDAAQGELERHGASVQVLGGGGVLAVFGVPGAQDDDSLRAVRAALALRAVGTAQRVGLATGEVVTGDPFVAGSPVDQAVALRDTAAHGEVLAEARTWRLVRHAVEASARGESWAIDSVDPEAAPLPRRLETPLVGRAREIAQISDDFERATREHRPHLVTIFGSPGIGKTRLAVECMQRMRETATAVFAGCRAAAQENTYAPLQELLYGLAEGDLESWIHRRLEPDADGAQLTDWLAAAAGAGGEPGRPEETAWAARRLLAGLAQQRPLLIVLDDVHWAAPAFLDLVESLVELGRAPLLVLCLARPDLVDIRPHWGGGRVSSSSILLDALTDEESSALVGRLTDDGNLDRDSRERILAAAEGNPLFIEQLLAAALEGDVDAVPDSIQTLLTARLDRLDDRDRAVAQAAAVCGTSFTTAEVAELVEADPSDSLLTLVRRELVRPGDADDPGGAGWSFRHGLIRDVAYGSLTKRRRAELHERLAARAIESGRDVDLVAGDHLDRAAQARREAGERGAGVDRLAAQAADHLVRAGVAAFERDDMPASVSLLGRANLLLPRESPERIELLLRLAWALVYRGEVPAAQELMAEARTIAVELGDARLAALATLLRIDATVSAQQVLRDVDDAVPVLEKAGDYEGLAVAEVLRFYAFDRAAIPHPESRLSVALEHARRANARQLESHVLGLICLTLHRGTLPVDDAIARATEIGDASTSAYVRSSALGALAILRAMKGEFDEARRLVEEDRRMLEELGLRQAAAAHSIAVSEVETIAGDDLAAERILRAGLDAVAAAGDEHSTTNVAWRLGLALVRQERYDEAESFVRIAERLEQRAHWVEVWCKIVLARIEAYRADRAQVKELVDDVVERMKAVDDSGFHADAFLEAAEALRGVGDDEDAAVLFAEAARIAERLGYVVALRRAEQAQRALTA
jgi:DNA-binding SARP family transcriptional activator/tetratricopeptide (TPR) repeat protein